MQLMPQGDHYVWYCEWCDTRNVTLWVRVEKNQLCCAACQKKFPVFEDSVSMMHSGRGSHYQLL